MTLPRHASRLHLLLLGFAALALAWALAIALTGGINARLAGVPIRSRDPIRPAAAAGVALLVYAMAFRDRTSRQTSLALDAWRRHATAVAVVTALASAGLALRFTSFSAGSSDAYGYVSQAYLWAQGRLPHGVTLPATFPWLGSDDILAPLGYRVSPAGGHVIVPTYAPGLPLLMAALLPLGAIGPFLLSPLCAGLAVWFTYRLGARAVGPVTGSVASIFLASSPTFQFQSFWAMSDVPAAAIWTGAALESLGTSRRSALASGAWTALGLLVRPNLPLVALVPFAWVLRSGPLRERVVRAAVFCAPIAPVVATVSALNAVWYGSPFNSGYGTASELYAVSNFVTNTRQFSAWLWQSHSPVILLAMVPLLALPALRRGRTAIGLAAAMVGAVFASYALYIPFEQWWFTRFLLPGAGAFMVLVAAGLTSITSRVPALARAILCVIVVASACAYQRHFSVEHGLYGPVREGERRYLIVGQYVADTLPSSAVVLAMQHSGAIRFYGGRLTIRYDQLRDAATAPAALSAHGYHPYLVADDWELPDVRRRFGLAPQASLPWPVTARMRERGGVTIFDLAPGATTTPVSLDNARAPLCPGPK